MPEPVFVLETSSAHVRELLRGACTPIATTVVFAGITAVRSALEATKPAALVVGGAPLEQPSLDVLRDATLRGIPTLVCVNPQDVSRAIQLGALDGYARTTTGVEELAQRLRGLVAAHIHRSQRPAQLNSLRGKPQLSGAPPSSSRARPLISGAPSSSPRAQPLLSSAPPRSSHTQPLLSSAPPNMSQTKSLPSGRPSGPGLKLGHCRLIAIGASTGGPEAIAYLLLRLPTTLPGIVIVQHMPGNHTGSFAQRLNKDTQWQVREARDGDRIESGLALIAPGGQHLRVATGGLNVSVSPEMASTNHVPSVDVLFESVALEVGNRALGVILTGMGEDGARGLLTLRKAGGHTMAQSAASCAVYGMPRRAIELEGANEIVALLDLPERISAHCFGSAPAQERARPTLVRP